MNSFFLKINDKPFMKNAKPLVMPLVGIAGAKLTNTSIKQNLVDSNIQFDTLMKINERFKPDGVFTFMDLTVEAEALGLEISFPENDTPSVSEHSVKDIEALNVMKANYKGVSGRMNVFIDTVKKMSEAISVQKGAYVIGPFSLACEMNSVNDMMTNLLIEPEFTHEIIDFCIEVVSDYTNELFKAGADTVCVLDPTAMMLAPEQYDEFAGEPFKKLLKNVNNQPLILHICGNTTHLIDNMCQTGACGLSLDSQVDFSKVIKQMPKNVDLIGNLDPVSVFLNGNKESILKSTANLREEMKEHSNFILSSGCDLPLETPLENIDAFMQN